MTVVQAALDATFLARWQFGITTIYHFILVPFTIGMSLCVAILQTMWYKTKKDHWLKATRFFGKLFLINFALGVATGIVQEFQFGMNWSEYARYVGDIFGAPLACEALLSFFMESTFFGLWIFGWGRISAKAHTVCIWLGAIGVNTSMLWIIGANSWMQQPVGAVYDPNLGRAALDGVGGFFKVILNPTMWLAVFHVITISWVLAGTFIAGLAIWWMVRSANAGAENEAKNVWHPIARFGLTVLLIGGILAAVSGHFQGQHLVQKQPAKMAAAEALCDTTTGAPFTIAAFGPLNATCADGNITHVGNVPKVFSFMATNDFSAEVAGINDLNANYAQAFGVDSIAPNVMLSFWSFRLMMFFGIFSAVLALWGLIATRGGRIAKSPALAKWAILSLPMPFIASSFGWMFTEWGRQPFIVYPIGVDYKTMSADGVWMLTSDAISGAVPAWNVLITLILFTLIYLALGVVWFLLMKRYAKEGIYIAGTDPEKETSPDVALSFGY